MKKLLLLICLVLTTFQTFNLNAQETIAFQSFEEAATDTWNFTPDPATYDVGGDVWARKMSLSSINPTDGSFFWGMQDLENPNGGGAFDHTLTFSNTDISGFTDVILTFDYHTIGYEASDRIAYTLVIDGSSQSEIVLMDDTGGNPVTITRNISNDFPTANSVGIIISANQNGGSDYAGVDNFELVGTAGSAPEPQINNITQSPMVGNVTSSDAVSVSADVTDDVNVATVELNWGTTSGMLTNTIVMSAPVMSDTYTTNTPIPAQADGTTVYYEIVATDSDIPTANSTTSPEQSYTVDDPLVLNTDLFQNFDGETPSWPFSSDTPFFGDPSGTGFLGVFDSDDISDLDNPCLMDNVLAENDLDSPGGTSGEARITFEEVDISANTGVNLSFDYQVVGYNANADDVQYVLILDGVAQSPVFVHNGGVDPDDSEGSISVAIDDAINTVSLQIVIENNGGTGYSGFDNFRLSDDTAAEYFTYTMADGWLPRSPDDATTPATSGSKIKVVSGNSTVAGNFDALDIFVAEGATFESQGDINLNGDLIISGSSTFNNMLLVGANGHEFLTNSAIGTINMNVLALDGGTSQALEISAGLSSVRILGGLIPNDGTITTNDNLTFASESGKTGVIGITTPTSIVGQVTVERFIPQGKRAFRLLTAPVNGAGTIRSNWQEGVNNSDVGIANNLNPNPGFGTHITGGSDELNTATAAEANAAGFDVTATNNPSMYTVNEQAVVAAYEAVENTNATNLSLGEGYLMLVRGNRSTDLSTNNPDHSATTLRATGTLELGDYTFTDLNPGTDNLAMGNGSSLIGNPYQSAVNMENALDGSTGIEQEFYHVFDATIGTRGAFVTVMFGAVIDGSGDTTNYTFDSSAGNMGDPATTDATRFLQPGQAAFINSEVPGIPPAAPSFTLTQASKVGLTQVNDGTFFTSSQNERMSNVDIELLEPSRINIALFNAEDLANEQGPIDAFTVRFAEEYDNALDSFDARKAYNLDENMATIVDEKLVSIQSHAMPVESDEIAISMLQYRSSNYAFRVATSGLNNVTPYLKDNYLGTLTELPNEGTTFVNFTVDNSDDASIAEDRFSIVFADEVLGNEDFTTNSFTVYPNPVLGNEFKVSFGSQSNDRAQITLVNLLGQIVLQEEFSTQNGSHTINVDGLQSGVYLVNITLDGNTTTKRIIKN